MLVILKQCVLINILRDPTRRAGQGLGWPQNSPQYFLPGTATLDCNYLHIFHGLKTKLWGRKLQKQTAQTCGTKTRKSVAVARDDTALKNSNTDKQTNPPRMLTGTRSRSERAGSAGLVLSRDTI